MDPFSTHIVSDSRRQDYLDEAEQFRLAQAHADRRRPDRDHGREPSHPQNRCASLDCTPRVRDVENCRGIGEVSS
jgi:hypothetical protein